MTIKIKISYRTSAHYGAAIIIFQFCKIPTLSGYTFFYFYVVICYALATPKLMMRVRSIYYP